VRVARLFLACLLVAGCGATTVTAGPAGPSSPSAAVQNAGSPSSASGSQAASAGAPAGAEAPIAAKGPSGWNRGPYDLAGGDYRLDWTSDGNCSALYFGIVGVDNGYKEQPPTAGDVALKDMLKGSRVIQGVPAGQYFFNVSGVACKSYSATLTRQ
jgi:hypothetical protein